MRSTKAFVTLAIQNAELRKHGGNTFRNLNVLQCMHTPEHKQYFALRLTFVI